MMRGLDTNILVRFITRDEPAQSETARELIETTERQGGKLHISTLVLVELVWVLRGGVYGFSRSDVAEVLGLVLDTRIFHVQDRDLVRRALAAFRRGPADFSDYLIGEQDRRAGCDDTLTFDHRLAEADGFTVPGIDRPYPTDSDSSQVSEEKPAPTI
jgi:predicted nucleic-acid-binding protein